MDDHNEKMIRNGLTENALSGFHEEQLTASMLNGVNGNAENDRDGDDSGSSVSPMDHMDLDDDYPDDLSNLIPEQDRYLPIANIGRIMKRAVPAHGKIAKEAKECVQECVSEFISFLTSEASDKCLQEKRKTITVEDMLTAMRTLDLDEYADVLTIYMKRFREAHRGRTDQPNESGTYPSDTSADEIHEPMQNEAGSSGVSGTANITETFTPAVIPGTGAGDQVVRVLPANAHVLIDQQTGNQYVAWQTPEGQQQLLQIQTTSTIKAAPVQTVRHDVNYVTTEPHQNIAVVSSGAPNMSVANSMPTRTYHRPTQNFRPAVQQATGTVETAPVQAVRHEVSYVTTEPHQSIAVVSSGATNMSPAGNMPARTYRPAQNFRPVMQQVVTEAPRIQRPVQQAAINISQNSPNMQFIRPAVASNAPIRPAGVTNVQLVRTAAPSNPQLLRPVGVPQEKKRKVQNGVNAQTKMPKQNRRND